MKLDLLPNNDKFQFCPLAVVKYGSVRTKVARVKEIVLN